MTISLVLEFATALFLFIGAFFTFVAAIGLLKLNDAMTRLHAPTKAGTVGMGAFLLAAITHAFAYRDGSIHEILILLFLFVTAPVSAHFIAKVNIHKQSCETPPSPPRDSTWSTLDVPASERADPSQSSST